MVGKGMRLATRFAFFLWIRSAIVDNYTIGEADSIW